MTLTFDLHKQKQESYLLQPSTFTVLKLFHSQYRSGSSPRIHYEILHYLQMQADHRIDIQYVCQHLKLGL